MGCSYYRPGRAQWDIIYQSVFSTQDQCHQTADVLHRSDVQRYNSFSYDHQRKCQDWTPNVKLSDTTDNLSVLLDQYNAAAGDESSSSSESNATKKNGLDQYIDVSVTSITKLSIISVPLTLVVVFRQRLEICEWLMTDLVSLLHQVYWE